MSRTPGLKVGFVGLTVVGCITVGFGPPAAALPPSLTRGVPDQPNHANVIPSSIRIGTDVKARSMDAFRGSARQSASVQSGHLVVHPNVPAGWTELTAQLRDRNPEAMLALATASGLTSAERLRKVTAAGPDPKGVRSVVAWVQSKGGSVVRKDTYTTTFVLPTNSLTAKLSSGSVSDSKAFGSALGQSSFVPQDVKEAVNFFINDSAVAQVSSTGVPPSPRSKSPQMVTPQREAIDPPTSALRLAGIYRDLYGAGAPASGPRDLVVATLEGTNFDQRDLSTFAGLVGLPDPVSSGQYRAISVDGTATTVNDGYNLEAAADQEILLATAPNANQAAYYFNPNSATSWSLALNRVASDAGPTGTYAGRLAALSTSIFWPESGVKKWNQGELAVCELALEHLAAIGVTVFAASGDWGGNVASEEGDKGVTFPASNPNVIGVGGITNSAGPFISIQDAPVMAERAWSGSGGGFSDIYKMPTWQQQAVPSNLLDPAHRDVPDIAATAYAAYLLGGQDNGGIQPVYQHTGKGWSGGAVPWEGGYMTSISAPIAAATLVNLEQNLRLPPQGNLLPRLYAPANVRAHRDILESDSKTFYAVGPGYDLVTGLGTPDWGGLLGAPLPGVPRGISVHPNEDRSATVTWASPTHEGASPLQGFRIEWRRVGRTSDVQTDTVPASSRSYTIEGLVPSARYVARVQALNSNGASELSASFAFDGRTAADTKDWNVTTALRIDSPPNFGNPSRPPQSTGLIRLSVAASSAPQMTYTVEFRPKGTGQGQHETYACSGTPDIRSIYGTFIIDCIFGKATGTPTSALLKLIRKSDHLSIWTGEVPLSPRLAGWVQIDNTTTTLNFVAGTSVQLDGHAGVAKAHVKTGGISLIRRWDEVCHVGKSCGYGSYSETSNGFRSDASGHWSGKITLDSSGYVYPTLCRSNSDCFDNNLGPAIGKRRFVSAHWGVTLSHTGKVQVERQSPWTVAVGPQVAPRGTLVTIRQRISGKWILVGQGRIANGGKAAVQVIPHSSQSGQFQAMVSAASFKLKNDPSYVTRHVNAGISPSFYVPVR